MERAAWKWPLFAAVACLWFSCLQSSDAPERSSPHGADAGARSSASVALAGEWAAGATDALRAAAIFAQQQGAGPEYAVRRRGDQLVAEARGFSVRYDALGAHIASERSGEHGGLALEQLGCAGETASVSAAAPSFEHNRVAYSRQVDGVAVEEWYLTGPMGLEQGFTVDARPACAAQGGELVLEVAAAGFGVRAEGDALVLEAAGGERYRYSDLFAKDAKGTALPARMSLTPAGRILLAVNVAGAEFPVEIDPLVGTFQAKLTASDGAEDDAFGYSVALSGDTALVGAVYDDDKGKSSGSAYVLVRTGTIWSQQAKLTASDGVASDEFGWSLALSGDTAVVGARLNDTTAKDAGSAYVFVRTGTAWAEQAKLTASDGAADDHFGYSVALSGDTTLVGAVGHDAKGSGSGGAYVFVRTGTAWSQQAKLTASDGAAGDQFGSSVALSGDTALVGSIYDDGNKGSAYVFVVTANPTPAWTEQAKLVASGGAADDQFGCSVALSGDTALVGFIYDDDKDWNSGSAYVFLRTGTSWAAQTELTAPDGATNDRFGHSVALSGNVALVGAPGFLGSTTHTGSAYLSTRAGTTWSPPVKLTPFDGALRDLFGWSVALDGATALVGSSQDDDNGNGSGSTYVYALKSANGDPCSAATQCALGFCVDGVCCGTACAGGMTDCQACSVAAGAAVNGTCGSTTGNACTDGNACTQTDTCQTGTCTGSNPVTCTASDQCHVAGTCNPIDGTCSNPVKGDGTSCIDGNACTQTDTCQTGICTGSNPVTCTASDQCHVAGTCDSTSGACSNPPKADGSACAGGTCQSGTCQPSGTGGTGGTSTGGTGGTGGTSTGGTGGTGGTSTGGTGGTGGTSTGGTGGTSTGGTGGTSTGGTAGAGGASTGGTAGAGGSSSGGSSSGGSSSGGSSSGGSSSGGSSSGGSSSGGSSSGGAGGSKAAPFDVDDDGGCGCRTAGAEQNSSGKVALLLLIGAAGLRRRRGSI